MKKNLMTHKTFVIAMTNLTKNFDKDSPESCLAVAQKIMPQAEFEFEKDNRLYAFWFDKLHPEFIKGIYPQKEAKTTPAQVRAELKRRMPEYNIFKTHQTWYVDVPGCEAWDSTSLCTFSFHGQPASWWVDIIQDMAKKHNEKQKQYLGV